MRGAVYLFIFYDSCPRCLLRSIHAFAHTVTTVTKFCFKILCMGILKDPLCAFLDKGFILKLATSGSVWCAPSLIEYLKFEAQLTNKNAYNLPNATGNNRAEPSCLIL